VPFEFFGFLQQISGQWGIAATATHPCVSECNATTDAQGNGLVVVGQGES
jgi:hypothetical protein